MQTTLPSRTAIPTQAEVIRIAAAQEPILRNLQITQCYAELSNAFAGLNGGGANWCTFATWASKQAGSTIRKEDLTDALVRMLGQDPGIASELLQLAGIAARLGSGLPLEQIRRSALYLLVDRAAESASVAVSKGNQKVFAEIAPLFARFLEHFSDCKQVFEQAKLDDFLAGLKPGPPPEGQHYLHLAFTHYYEALFATDPKQAAELQLLANLEIGFHEQTRLQPEIGLSLEMISFQSASIKTQLMAVLFPPAGVWSRLKRWLYQLLRSTSLLDAVIETLLKRVAFKLRHLLTQHLMTLTIPPQNCLQLGKDLNLAYPEHLQQVSHPALLQLLKEIDPTIDSLQESGAADWANLQERLHYIADLFRCCHANTHLFEAPFSAQQTGSIKAGTVPDEPL